MPEQFFIVRKPLMVGSTVVYAAGPGEEPVRINAYGWENLDVLIAQGYLIADTVVPAPEEAAEADASEAPTTSKRRR